APLFNCNVPKLLLPPPSVSVLEPDLTSIPGPVIPLLNAALPLPAMVRVLPLNAMLAKLVAALLLIREGRVVGERHPAAERDGVRRAVKAGADRCVAAEADWIR